MSTERLSDNTLFVISQWKIDADIPRLIAEIELLSHQLADCWILINRLATGETWLHADAVELLRGQRVPGWK